MRADLPLREITIEEIYKDVQKLRNELQTHTHLDIGGNAQLLTGEVKGILQSPNFVSSSSGWQILPTGSVEFNSGFFRGDLAIGSGNDIIVADSDHATYRFWIGHATTPTSAAFAVEKDGTLHATGAVITGTITASSIHIPDENTTANSFHADPDGNAWWGCTHANFDSDNDNALAYVLKTGVAKFQSITVVNADVVSARYIEPYTAGENITSGNAVCIKPEATDISPSEDSYVNENHGGTNYGSGVDLYVGELQTDKNCYSFIKFSMAGVPATNRILKAELRLRRHTFIYVGTRNIEIHRVSSADWVEGTITWDNKPTATDDIADTYGMVRVRPTGASPGWMVWDITQLVRQWKAGNVNNYGLLIRDSAASAGKYMSFDSKEGADVDERPILRVYDIQDSDGKAYKADCSDYSLCRSVTGIALENISADASGSVQTHGTVSGLGGQWGFVYLSTVGGITWDTTNLNRIIQISKTGNVSGSGILNIQTKDILIEKLYNPTSTTGAARRFYTLSDARYAVIYVKDTQAGNFYYTVLRIDRGSHELTSYRHYASKNGIYWDISWNAANNYIEIDASTVTSLIQNIYFYT